MKFGGGGWCINVLQGLMIVYHAFNITKYLQKNH